MTKTSLYFAVWGRTKWKCIWESRITQLKKCYCPLALYLGIQNPCFLDQCGPLEECYLLASSLHPMARMERRKQGRYQQESRRSCAYFLPCVFPSLFVKFSLNTATCLSRLRKVWKIADLPWPIQNQNAAAVHQQSKPEMEAASVLTEFLSSRLYLSPSISLIPSLLQWHIPQKWKIYSKHNNTSMG